MSIKAGLSQGFLVEWWKWPNSTPIPRPLGCLPRAEKWIKNITSSFLFSMVFEIADKAT